MIRKYYENHLRRDDFPPRSERTPNFNSIIKIGKHYKYPAVTLAEARKKRDEARAALNDGKHPTREKKLQRLRQAHDGENSFAKVAIRWMETKQTGLNEKYAKQCRARMEEHIFPMIGDLPQNLHQYSQN